MLVHTPDYYRKVSNGELTEKEIRRIGLPWSPALFFRTMYAIGGTIDACRTAASEGIAANLAGGTHHAHADFGQGYCVFNDVAIAARVAQKEGVSQSILIIDCDAHQGNGSAEIFKQDPSVFTFSIHGKRNFPYNKAASDLDIALPDGAGDDEYLTTLCLSVPDAISKAKPDLVFYIAGADPFSEDNLGRLGLSKSGLAQRDRWVLEYCRKLDLSVVIVLGGGYSRLIEDVVDIHMGTMRAAADISQRFGRKCSLTEIQ